DPGLANQAGAEGDQSSRAWWLIGCTLVYGLMPRLLALGLCAVMGWRRWPRIGRFDLCDADLGELAARFAQLDAAAGGPPAHTGSQGRASVALVGFELPPDTTWPLLRSSGDGAWDRCLPGEASERREVIELALSTRPRALLVVCRAAATPDLGTERFVRALTAHADRAALWLQGHGEHPAWRPWLARPALSGLAVLRDDAQAGAWIDEVRRG
ncbi:MAG TPA: DUF2868 domain-containing protein, partial [Ideonella sp.]|nr:DUF2868 domain-containing protein [Ideonella sp.]